VDIEKIAQRLQRLWAQVEANEALLLKHAKRHDAQTAADPLTITSSAHARLHTLQNALDHSGTISSTQHGTQASGDLHTEYQKESEREAASGYAGLDASSKVIKDPANATATPAASKIPIADAGGKLAAGWLQEVLAYADLTDDPYADHNARHESGGADAIKLDDLAAPDDNTDLNVALTKHGLCPKAPNDTYQFLRGDGFFGGIQAAALPGHGPSKHTEGTAWRLIYLNADGDETEIVLGADGTFLESNGAAAAPAFTAIVMAHLPTAAKQVCITMIDLDAGTASTSVPKYSIIVPFACTITDIEIILGGDQTCGATSIIADIHKIAAADRDTGGTGTTIYTTQGNRPTVANTHRYALATDPDVTAVAAGDALLLYIDQAGSGVTNCTVTITATKT